MDHRFFESPEFVFDPKLSSTEKVVYRFNGDLEEQPKQQQEFASSTKSNISLLSSRGYMFYLEGVYSPPTIDPWDDDEYEEENDDDDDDVDDTVDDGAERLEQDDDMIMMTSLGCCCGCDGCDPSYSHSNGNKIQGETPFIHLSGIGNGNEGATTMEDKRFIEKTIKNYQWSIYGELNDDSVVDDDEDETRQDTDNEGGHRKLKFGGNRRLLLAQLRNFKKKRSSAIEQKQRTSDPCTYAEKISAAAAAATTTTTPWRIRLSILSKCDVEQEDSLEVTVRHKQKKEGGKTLRKLWNLFIPSTDNNQILTGTQLHAKDDGVGGMTIVADDDVHDDVPLQEPTRQWSWKRV